MRKGELDPVRLAFREHGTYGNEERFIDRLIRADRENPREREVLFHWGCTADSLDLRMGQFVCVFGLQGHGKTTLLMQLMHEFHTNNELVSLYSSYQLYSPFIKAKFLNVVSLVMDGHKVVTFGPDKYGCMSAWPNHVMKVESPSPEDDYVDSFCRGADTRRECGFLEDEPLSRIETVIDYIRKRDPTGKIVLFVDDIDGLEFYMAPSSSVYCERIWEVADALRRCARDKDILIVASYRTADRELKGAAYQLYTASTSVLEILNRSCPRFKKDDGYRHLYRPPVKEQSVCELNLIKNRHGMTLFPGDQLLFDGNHFSL